MLNNYFKIAIRNLWKSRLFSSINIIGLTIGLTSSLLIFAWIWDEININQFHKKSDHLYQLLVNMKYSDGSVDTWRTTPYPLVKALKNDYPEIEEATLLGYTNDLFHYQDEKFKEEGYHVDPNFFNMFSFPFIAGDVASIFNQPLSIVVSRSFAEKLIDSKEIEKALGLQVTLNKETDFIITGVFENVPDNSSLYFNYAIDYQYRLIDKPWEKDWANFNNPMYVLLKEGTDLMAFNSKIKNALQTYRPDESEGNELYLQSFKESYLYSVFENGKPVGGRIEYVRILFAGALFLMFIACINFTNLTTARSSKRAKEIGVRKVVGASRYSLIRQFMGEALLTTFVAIALAIGLSEILLPHFYLITGKMVTINYTSPLFWLGILAILFFTVLFSGAYPAFFLSALSINSVIKNQVHQKLTGSGLRKTLVVFQFVLSTILIIGAIVVSQQIRYIENKNLGINRENLLYLPLQQNMHKNNEAFRAELSNAPGIKEFMQINQNPLFVGNNTNSIDWETKNKDDNTFVSVISSDHNFINTMNVEIINGRDFHTNFKRDSTNYMVNESMVKKLGVEDPIGMELELWGKKGNIIGVTKDFHFRPLQYEISPLILRCAPEDTYQLFVRTAPGQSKEAIASLEKIHEKFAPAYPFDFKFLDTHFARLYESEQTTGKLAQIFALIAIFISCLGLFGLTAFVAEQKTKEIGIRKILGATVTNIVTLLSIDFLKLVLIALIIGSPIAWYLMKQWLTNYAYSIELNWWIIGFACMIALVIAFITISFQSFKAAVSNPVEALRSE